MDGRPRGHLRTPGPSRARAREQAHAGSLTGVTASPR
ncbi:hypothetical protein [Streptomyces sp. URMC 125]